MRYIVLTLLALNLLYLGYNQFPDKTTDVRSVQRLELPTIELLKDSGDRAGRERQMDEVVNNPVLLVEDDESECTALGPFSSITKGQMVLERLEALEVSVELRAIDKIMGEFDYRVMIAPAVSLEVAFRKLRELQSQDIDSYVITKGKNALGISLGVFSNPGAATGLKEQMADSGYQVNIVDIARLTRGYWIFSGEGLHLIVGDGFLESLQLEFPEVGQNAQMCIRKGDIDQRAMSGE